ncbi:hydantoinase/oxoprolinase family protein [Halobacterium sp. KA-6]|uniref:hydantoinase/oxoprolinase family protein n=1 Tax=Halobacterium sp. KA-6 TaxID=2896368 RepID=UPI001E34DC6E|nr:hydantoinase/oxoprolinase family protein [Halobacterium sp. KA-6]MCD2204589.1 hydantoinase/oxoprolinase family protein [Halobacterium sp. KA-6]
MTVRIGIDTGGTFTDVVYYDEETGEVSVTKTPSTPPNFDQGVLNGIEKILAETGADPGEVSFLSHGTTVGTNAVLEEEIPPLGLITNEGLRDVLEIGDQTRPELYNLQTEKPPMLISRRHRKEVPGRLNADGEEVDPLDEAAVREVAHEFVDTDVESVVVSMLFSYLNPDHERRVVEIVESETGLDCTRSSAVHPEIREYDRTITTVLNEAVKTTVEEYFARLDKGILERDIDVPLNVMHSGGGIFGTQGATEAAIRTVLSGPAAGAVATRDVTHAEGYPNAIGIDMGGTSADVSIVREGEIVRSTSGKINDLPVNTPMIDINTVGSGGGSIAWLDAGGGLHVGPESAGADPGPICYGRGGEQPTLTDANLLLGRVSPENFLGGEMDLAVERTREIFETEIANPLGETVEEAALSVVRVANAGLAREIRRVTVERGHNPASFALVAFGGAGPMQAPSVAAELDVKATIIPRNPGVFSARGLLLADMRMDESRSARAAGDDPDAISEGFDELITTLLERFEEQSIDPETVTVERSVDLRYKGQSYELTVDAPDGEIDTAALETVRERFHAAHERRYGYGNPDESVEFVTLRVNGVVPTPRFEDALTATDEEATRTSREVYFADSGYRKASVYRREELAPGTSVEGPAILEGAGSTTVVPPETTASISADGNVVITR